MRAAMKKEARKDYIARTVVDIICVSGLDCVTIRNVAKTAGYSTALLTHHFTDKREVLLYTYKWVSDISYRRVREAMDHDPADLVAFLEAIAHVDEPEYWKVHFAFFEIAMNDDSFKKEQQRRAEDAKHFIYRILLSRDEKGLPVLFADREQAAKRLILAVQGLGIQSVLHDKDWTPDEKRAFLVDLAETVTGPAAA